MFPITLKRLTIRPFRASDITDNYISWLNDPEIVKFSNQRFIHHNRETCKAFLNSIDSSDAIFLIIICNESKDTLGTITVHFCKNHLTADIGILLGNKAHWGKGFGEEAWSAVMEFLIKKINVRKVTGGTLSCNKGMLRVFEKVGMVPDGLRKDHELVNGKSYDILHFAKFKL